MANSVFRVLKEERYTIISNEHLFDKNLSHKATNILTMMLALPPNWDFTLAGLASLKKDGIDSVRAGIKELEDNHYVLYHRLRNEKGQLQKSEYLVFESVEKYNEYIKTSEHKNAENTPFEPKLEKPILDNPILEKPILENPMQSNTKILNTNILSTNLSYQSKEEKDYKVKKSETSETIDTIRKNYQKIIYQNIDYDIICETTDKQILDDLIGVMLDTLTAKNETVRIAKQDIDTEAVKSMFLKIDSELMEYAVTSIRNTTTKIRNVKSYMLTTLYNAGITYNTALHNSVMHNLHGKE